MFGLFLCGQLLPHLSVLYWMHESTDGGVIAMKDYSVQNKRVWEYNAYDFWVRTAGSPAELAARVMADPMRSLKRYARYFDAFEGCAWPTSADPAERRRCPWRFWVRR